MPVKNRHRVFPGVTGLSPGQFWGPHDFSAYGMALVYHTDDVTVQGSPDGGATWMDVQAFTGNGVDVVELPPQTLRVRTDAGVSAAVYVEGLRNIGD